MSVQAIEVLLRVRDRAASKEWTQHVYALTDSQGVHRTCLHTMAADEVRKTNRSAYPTPLDGEVFHALWDALPEDHTIPSFNDASGTTQNDVVRVVDKALQIIFWPCFFQALQSGV